MLSQSSSIRLSLPGILAAILLTVAVGNTWTSWTNNSTNNSKKNDDLVEQSQPLTNLDEYVGAQGRSRTSCALIFVGAGLGLTAAAITAMIITGGAGAVIIGVALAGAYTPALAGFC